VETHSCGSSIEFESYTMSLSGKIEDFSVLELFQFIHSTQKTGILNFQRKDENAVQISFQEGHIIRPSAPTMMKIGHWLLHQGHITQDALDHALRHQATSKPKRPLGMVLKEMGHVTHETIRDAVIYQIEEVIQNLLTWKHGTFHFDAQDTKTPDQILLMLEDLVLPEEVNTEFLLLEAVRKFDEASAQQKFSSKKSLSVPKTARKKLRLPAIAVKAMLLKLHLTEFTGKIILQKDQIKKTLFYQKGNPVFVDSTIRSETLGQMLVEQGTLTEDQYDKVLQKMEREKRRQGEILVELGYLSAYEVFELLKHQIAQKVRNSFLLEGAGAEIEEGASHLERVPHLPIDFFRILLETFYAKEKGKQMNRVLRDRALLLSEPGGRYFLTRSLLPLESKIVRLLDGTKRFEELVDQTGGDPDKVGAFIDALGYAHFLEFTDRPLKKRQSQTPSHIRRRAVPRTIEEKKRRKIVTAPSKAPRSSPIYMWALRLDHPYHELLKISLHATRFQARHSYDSIVRELHLNAIDEYYETKERNVAELVLDRLTLAVTVLSDEKQRRDYIKSIGTWKTTRNAPSPALAAEVCIRKANLYLGKKQYERAEEESRRAIKLHPTESSYHVELADVLYHKALAEKTELPEIIEKELTEARRLNSSNEAAYFQFGRLAKLNGDLERARNYFQRAVELKPNHPQALSELRWINRRLDGKRKLGNIFRSLFR